MQEQGGTLVFCSTRRQCELSAMALTQHLTSLLPDQADGVRELRPQRMQMAMDLLAAQGGQIVDPLRDMLLSCAGVAYHHAGTFLARLPLHMLASTVPICLHELCWSLLDSRCGCRAEQRGEGGD